MTDKQAFRLRFGTDLAHRCKDCTFFRKFYYHNKNYYKCERLGISNSVASDIRLKDFACGLFVGEVKKNETD